jgi:hypothetical protein
MTHITIERALLGQVLDTLWVLNVRNALHHGTNHDTVTISREALAICEQALAQPVQDLEKQLNAALNSLDFYRRRADALQQWQSKMRDPERTIVCDILANGHTLEPAGDRYTTPPAAQRQWIGLTLADRGKLRDHFKGWKYPAILVDVVSDMLQEKNA